MATGMQAGCDESNLKKALLALDLGQPVTGCYMLAFLINTATMLMIKFGVLQLATILSTRLGSGFRAFGNACQTNLQRVGLI